MFLLNEKIIQFGLKIPFTIIFRYDAVIYIHPTKCDSPEKQTNLLTIPKNFNNLYEAISAAFPEKKINPRDMKHAPYGYYDSCNSATAVREMVLDLISKGRITHRREINIKHFQDYHLRSALRVFDNKILNAINAAFPEEEPLVSSHVPRGFFNEKENRIRKLRELAASIGKEGKDITHHDLKEGHMSTILHYHNGNLFEALLEAGLATQGDKEYVTNRAARNKKKS